MNRSGLLAVACCAVAVLACSESDDEEPIRTSEHEVYFVGYAYNGATGARLTAAQITAVNIRYRDQVIATTIEPDGRFVTATALPTWQDYAVSIVAPGFRPFVSRNVGIDVPASLATADSVVSTKTVQTFQVEASLLPQELKAPKLTLTIDQSDALTTMPPPPRASGSVRLRPQSQSVLEATQQQAGAPTNRRRWFNDEDLLTQTVTKPFADGRVEIAEGELLYGVPYQLTVFGVPGYQPLVMTEPLVAGQVSSRTITITRELRDALRILAINTDTCVPPAGTANEYGAAVVVEFDQPVEFVGANAPEEIDNGVIVTPSGSTVGGSYCSLRPSMSPTMQERGSKAVIEGSRLTLSFNPTVGFATSTGGGFACMVPPSLTSVTYSNLGNVVVRPIGDQTRKRTLAELVTSFAMASGTPSSGGSLTCGTRPGSVF